MTSARGFTVVELLVSIAISAVILTIAVSAYRNFQTGQELSQASKTLQANLRFAQNQAFGGVKNCGTDPLIGWYVKFQPSSYSINSRCGANLVPVKSISLPSGTTMSFSLNADILFQPINQDVVFLPDAGTATPPFISSSDEMTITLTNSSRSSKVVGVRKTGDIYEQ